LVHKPPHCAKPIRLLASLYRLCRHGDTSEQKVFFFHGEGRNGKSTFVDAWAHVLGNYAADHSN
jgi:phage/plasmid-associated DNA primase